MFGDYVLIGAAVVVGAYMAVGIFVVLPVMAYVAIAMTWEWIADCQQRRQRARRVEPAWITGWEADIKRHEGK